MISQPPVTVVVSTYSMERFADITELLDSLACQTYRNFETILVVEKSRELNDKAGQYVKEKGYNNVRLLFNTDVNGLSAARNLGVREAKGEIIAFIDDDALAQPDWLAEIVKIFQSDKDIIGVTGPILPLWQDDTLKWLPEEFYWIISCKSINSSQPVKVRNAWGTNMSFRKEAFNQCGLFLDHLGAKGGGIKGKNEPVGEDTEFSIRVCMKTKGEIVYNPNSIVRHRCYCYRLKPRFVVKRAYWEGYTKALFNKLLRNKYDNILSVEYRLLRRVLFTLLPSTLAGMITKPADSWQRLKLITVALVSIAAGYCRGVFADSDLLGGVRSIEYL